MPSQPRLRFHREALIEILEWTAAAGVFQWEGNHRARVVEDLDLRASKAGSATCAHSGCGGCVRTPPWGSFRLTGTNGSSETRGGYYGNCLTLLL